MVAHAVYGLILTMATLGELFDHEVPAGESALWLAAAAGVLLGAHWFSDTLAHVAATRSDPDWPEILRIGHHDIIVAAPGVAMAAVMVVAELAELDAEGFLLACMVAGLLALAMLCLYATAQHQAITRVVITVGAVAFAAVVVVLENTV